MKTGDIITDKVPMSFIDAVELMKKGNKLTHKYFSSNEWVTIENGKMIFEDGVRCTPNQFIMDRTSLEWNQHWELFKP